MRLAGGPSRSATPRAGPGRCPDRAALRRGRGAPACRRRRPGLRRRARHRRASRSMDRRGRAGERGDLARDRRRNARDWRRAGRRRTARPSQARSSWSPATSSGRDRTGSISSIRSSKRPPVPPREGGVEEGGKGMAEMQAAVRARREAEDRGLHRRTPSDRRSISRRRGAGNSAPAARRRSPAASRRAPLAALADAAAVAPFGAGRVLARRDARRGARRREADADQHRRRDEGGDAPGDAAVVGCARRSRRGCRSSAMARCSRGGPRRVNAVRRPPPDGQQEPGQGPQVQGLGQEPVEAGARAARSSSRPALAVSATRRRADAPRAASPARMRRAVSRPSRPGMRMSIRARSKGAAVGCRDAGQGLQAVPREDDARAEALQGLGRQQRVDRVVLGQQHARPGVGARAGRAASRRRSRRGARSGGSAGASRRSNRERARTGLIR